MKRILGLLMAFMLCLGVFTLMGGVNTVYAADIASGTYDGVSWKITEDGELILGNGETQTLTNRSTRYAYSWPWNNYYNQIVSIKTSGTVVLQGSLYGMFFHDPGGSLPYEQRVGYPNCVSIDLSTADFAGVTNMQYAFLGMPELVSITFPEVINTVNNTSLYETFAGDRKLESMDLSTLNTSKVTSMFAMFFNCRSLPVIDVSDWDVSKVVNAQSLFNQCFIVEELDVSNWNTSNMTIFDQMFANCQKLKSLDLSNFNTSKCTLMGNMFYGCKSLTYLDLSSFNTDLNVGLYGFLYNCTNLEEVVMPTIDTRDEINMENFCGNCPNLKKITIGSNFRFKGNNISQASRQVIFPNPVGSQYSGRWVCEDGSYGPYTPAELRDNYTSDMAGTWVWEMAPCAVFSDDGTLSFIRPTSDSTYTSGSTGTVKSISGGEYTGTIFSVYLSNPWRATWDSVKQDVQSVIFVDDIGHPGRTSNWFSNMPNCKSFDVSKLDISQTSEIQNMFKGCTALEEIDISGFDNTNAQYYSNIFYDCPNLKKIKLGENWSFKGGSIIEGFSANDVYTGKWIREDKAFGPYTWWEFEHNYNAEMAGTWVWELAPTEYTISFEAGENGTGAMQSVNGPAKEDFTLPANQFVAFGYDFDHWDDGNGKTYADNGTIPANTYAADTKVTLTAVWKKRDTSLNWDGNEAMFSIRGGEQAVLDNIPAGTSYQVYELTPDGWILVQQENASGVIEALEESAAAFWNKYQPGVTTVQFSGLKNLDGRPAEAGKFTFELYEGETLVDTATTQDGGFIQFKVIEYDAAGDHVYTIREVDPNDDAIDYDTHEETVEVSVTDNGDGTLSSEVTYDDDGIVFSNTTRPGTLRITKDATNGTSQNVNDEFTLEIEFRNESGMPISDDIYWYVEGVVTIPSEISDGNQE